ncbi:variable large family protein [Borrelia duttonii]|uniref:Variable large protein n=1 Tax=Borrelia duttonii (strain Ly) TaxID=412419 RepID=B5RNZ2_BORDL|nr:vlp protein, gamma subfamily [Borrelia duttonii Ly]
MKKEKKEEGRIRVIMVMMMVMMGCNSGVVEAEQGKNKFLQSLVNVSNEFLNVFTSFGDMVGSVLGLSVESKKSDVGNYFNTVQSTVEGIKSGLNKIVAEMKEEKNPNAEATATAVKTLVESKLDKIIAGAKEASEAIGVEGSELIGNVATAGAAGGAAGEIEKLVKGIKGIVEVVLKEGKHDAGDDKKASDGSTSRTGGNAADGEAGKLFANDNAGANANDSKKVATDAAKAVGGVRGSDILQAIVRDGGDALKLATAANGGGDGKKDAIIAGAIALRGMAKGGKFANDNDGTAEVTTAVKGASISAVTKALDTLTIAIRKIIDAGLKEVKAAMKINANAIPVVSDKIASDAKNQ